MLQRKRLLQERMRKTLPSSTMTSSATGEGHPVVPSTQHPTPSSTAQPRMRETSAPAGMGRVESVHTNVGHNEVEIEKMEQRVRDALWSQPLHTSTVASTGTAASTVPLSFHGSYHGETSDQLRNRSRQPTSWDPRHYNPATYVHAMPPNRSVPIYPYLQPSPTPLPSFNPTLPSSPQHVLLQSNSQEWTDYTCAPTDSTQTVPNDSTAMSQSASLTSFSQGPAHDLSEFDPIQS